MIGSKAFNRLVTASENCDGGSENCRTFYFSEIARHFLPTPGRHLRPKFGANRRLAAECIIGCQLSGLNKIPKVQVATGTIYFTYKGSKIIINEDARPRPT